MLQNLRDQTQKEAEEVVQTKWPEKILRLNKLLERDEFQELSKDDIEKVGELPPLAEILRQTQQGNGTIQQQSAPKKRKVDQSQQASQSARRPTKEEASGPCGSVDWSKFEGGKDGPGPDIPSNKVSTPRHHPYTRENRIGLTCLLVTYFSFLTQCIIEMMNMLRHEVKEAVSALGTVKMWIQLMVPRIEDGNNFGVEVQEEIISEVSRIEDASFQVCAYISFFFWMRKRERNPCLNLFCFFPRYWRICQNILRQEVNWSKNTSNIPPLVITGRLFSSMMKWRSST